MSHWQGTRAMKRSNSGWWAVAGLVFVGILVTGAMSQNPSPADLRARSQKLMQDGNFRDAYDGFRRLCLNPGAGPAQVSQDLVSGVQCLNHLGRVQELDELVESTVAQHQDNWRLLQTAAQQYA